MDGKRVSVELSNADLRLLCMGLHRIGTEISSDIENLKREKTTAFNNAYEEDINTSIAEDTRELKEISNLYERLSNLRS